MTKRKRHNAMLLLALVCLLVMWGVIGLDRDHYLTAFWTGTLAVATIAILFPTRCHVTTDDGKPCPNRSNGILFGCRRASHTWVKFTARFGSRERVTQPSMGTVGVVESSRSTFLFWITVATTAVGAISMLTDMAGLLR